MILKSYEIEKNINSFLDNNLFLLYGENEGLKFDIRDLIKKKISTIEKNTEIISIYEDEIIDNKDYIYNSIYSGSLFSNKKILIINSGSDKIFSILSDIYNKYPKNVFIIILSNVLEKKSKLRNLFETEKKTICIPCYLDSDKTLEIIAKTELKKNNIPFSNELINLLTEKSNFDRNNLKSEIEKIKHYSITAKKIDINEIRKIINFSGEYKSENLVNECLCGNLIQLKKILSEMYFNNVNQIFILRILSNKIQRLLNMKIDEKKHQSLDILLNSVKPPIFWKEKTMVKRQLVIWNEKKIKKIIDDINNIELQCKKNPQISKIIFFNFVADLCKKASSYA